MSGITIKGTVQKSEMGSGTWSLMSDSGMAYELHHDAPEEMLQEGQQVKVHAQVRDDIMSNAMIGPVIEIHSFELSKPVE